MTFSPIKTISTKLAVLELHEMLTYMRPHGTPTEQAFVSKFIDPLPNVWADGYGNRHVVIGDTNVLWSSHTDSVHNDHGRQVVLKRDGHFGLKPHQPKQPSCLGADCATGVWIMRHMILRGVPGHYIFHRDEECGGLGSSWVAKNDPDLLNGIEIAVAFDRKGYHSVITHQGGRTASDAFAHSIADLLGGKYEPDSSGIFTDTAKYASIIPECSNLSVGYHDAHSSQETQDYEFACELLDKVCELDTSKLVVSRDPKVVEYRDYRSSYYGGGSLRWTDHYDDRWDDWGFDTPSSSKNYQDTLGSSELARPSGSTNYARLKNILMDYPDDVADWLDNEGIDADDLADVILARYAR